MGRVLDILIVAGIAILAVWAVFSMRGNCCGGCSRCPMAGKCAKREDDKHE